MKRNDPNFKEQFIILHDDEGELIVRKSEIIALQLSDEINNEACLTYVRLCNGGTYYVHESVDEILELL